MFELRKITLGGLISEVSQKFSEEIAIEYTGEKITYRQLDEVTDNIARGFAQNGVKKGSHVGIWANDRPNTLLCFLAAVKLGAVAVMLGTGLNKLEISGLIEQADIEFLLFDEGFRDTSFPDVCRELTQLAIKRFIYIGTAPEQGFTSLDDMIRTGSGIAFDELERLKSAVNDSDEDTILFTSGTTGTSRGVVTTHFSRVNTAFAHADSLEVAQNDKFLIAIPMFHCFSLTGGVLTALCKGACVYFPENRRTHTLLKAISDDKCTIFNAVPTLFSAIMARDDLDSYDTTSLRTGFIGGSVYSPEFFIKVSRTLGFTLMPALGQTEATAGFTFTDISDSEYKRAYTIGKFMSYIEGEIRDISTGAPLPPGERGEICIRGFNVMKGYYAQPVQTRAVLSEDGWLRTGDLGYLGEDGYIRMTGRLKELIIRGGENITPGEIEDIIAGDSRVSEVKVIAVPDAHYGEEICACVELRRDNMTEEEVKAMVREKLAYFKIPKYVLFLNELPRTSGGKISLAALQEYAKKELFA